MADTWITDMTHYLDRDGELGDLPTPALNLALFQGSIVSWVTSHGRPEGGLEDAEKTNVYCRRSPGRRRCRGQIRAGFDAGSSAILWHCPVCGDQGYIRGWEATLWDRSFDWKWE